jgi:hypothetical protein
MKQCKCKYIYIYMLLHGSVKQCKYITIKKKFKNYLRKFKKKTHQHSRVGDLSFCGKLSFNVSLIFLSASITVPTCTATIISLEPCALDADFQHFIFRSNEFPYLMDTPERRVWVKGGPKTG